MPDPASPIDIDDEAVKSISLPPSLFDPVGRENESDRVISVDIVAIASGAAFPRPAQETSDCRTETRHSRDCRLRCDSSDRAAKAGSLTFESVCNDDPVDGKGEWAVADVVSVPGRSVVGGK